MIWESVFICVPDSEGSHIADMWKSKKEATANARRIVACVNACAGWTDAELEVYAETGIRTYSFETVKAVNARAEAAEAKLDRVRSITVEEIAGRIAKNEGIDTLYNSVRMRLAESIHRLLTERMEGE